MRQQPSPRADSAASNAASPAPIGLLATALRRERERAGMSLAELARRAGLAKSTLSQLESGTGNPSRKRCGRWRWRWMCRSAG